MFAYISSRDTGFVTTILPNVREISHNKIITATHEIEGINHKLVSILVTDKVFEVGNHILDSEPDLRGQLTPTLSETDQRLADLEMAMSEMLLKGGL